MTVPRRLVAGVAVVAVLIATWVRLGPLPAGFLELGNAESTEVLDRNGELLYEARSGDGARTAWLSADRLPRALVDATLAAEDRRFFRHPGIDPIAIVRATARNVTHRRWLEGGSTISQQVVKALLARKDSGARRTLTAKVREAVLAVRLEHHLSKREILALYVNLAPYGNQLTGANRASRAYFGHDAALLTAAQAAYLAALPQRPSSYNPFNDPERARRRQQRIIVRMGLDGMLDPLGVRAALDERLALERPSAAFVAPHFVARVLATCPEACQATHTVAGGGRRVVTTLDASLQRAVNGIIRAARPSLEKHGAHNVAAVVLDNATGEWLAWEGSGDYGAADHGGTIDGVTTPRQPGSALKPFTYALAFEDGDTPASVLPDIPSFFPTAQDGVVYSPRNYDGRFRGPLLARRALAGSQNVPAVALASRVGVASLLRFLRSAGFSTLDKTGAYYGLGLTLGDAEVRLDELVVAYSAFARGGTLQAPTLLRDGTGRPTRTLVSDRTAFWITDILSDDEARAYAFGRGGSLEFPFQVAAKTGTSQAYHDNWAVGYTRDVTVGVWVGNFDRRALVGSSGVTGAGPIFHAIMLAAASRAAGGQPAAHVTATAATPARATRRPICALSGMAATSDCPAQIDEWVGDDRRVALCDWHRQTGRGVEIAWPAEFRAWATANGGTPLSARAASTGDRVAAAADRQSPPAAANQSLRVVNPPDGAVYLLDPTLRREFQTIGLRGASDRPTRIEWRVDDAPIGAADADASLDWPLTPGRHVISAHDARGRRAAAAIVVK